jgi:hypothetical protein
MTNEANDSPASFLAKKHPPSNIAAAESQRDFYSVLEGRQRIGGIRFVIERMPGVWLADGRDRVAGGPTRGGVVGS